MGAMYALITFLSTVKQRELINSLRYLKLPPFLTMATVLTFRFTPVYLGMALQVREAQRARAFTIKRGPLIRRIKAIGENVRAMMVPVIHSMMKMVGEITLCLDSKGWVVREREELQVKIPFKMRDKVFIALNIAILVVFGILRFTGISWIPMRYQL